MDVTLIMVMYIKHNSRCAVILKGTLKKDTLRNILICPAHDLAFETQELQLPRRPLAFKTFSRTRTRSKSQLTWE